MFRRLPLSGRGAFLYQRGLEGKGISPSILPDRLLRMGHAEFGALGLSPPLRDRRPLRASRAGRLLDGCLSPLNARDAEQPVGANTGVPIVHEYRIGISASELRLLYNALQNGVGGAVEILVLALF